MNKENPVLQRDQIKRPIFHKLVNSNSNGLSSPFPFMEFGLSTQSSLNNVYNNYSRENGITNKLSSTKLENQDTTKTLDPYMKPLSLDHLKSTNSLNKEMNNSLQYGHNFFRFSSNKLKNNDFSDNFFLRIQSTKNDNIGSNQKKSNVINQINDATYNLNEVNKLSREKRPNTSILTPKQFGILNSINKDLTMKSDVFDGSFKNIISNGYSNIRPSTAGPMEKLSRDINLIPMPVVGTQPTAKFYVKSFKTDALIYNPINKIEPAMNLENKVEINQNSNFKIPNSQNLYLQVKQEVEEYRKQRRQEVMLDVNIQPNIKSIFQEDLFKEKEINIKSLKDTENLKPSNTNTKSLSETDESNLEIKKKLNTISKKPSENKNNKHYKRPKSVTFNEKVETRDFFDGSSSESDTDDSNDASNDASSTDNESHGSVVSTESDSEKYSKKKQLNSVDCTNISSSLSNLNELSKVLENGISDKETGAFGDGQKEVEKLKTTLSGDSSSSDDDSDDDEESTTTNGESMSDTDKSSEKDVCKSDAGVPIKSVSEKLSKMASSNREPRSLSLKSQRSSEINFKKASSESKTKGPHILTKQDLIDMSALKESQHQSPLIFSNFSNVVPVINFVGEGEKIEQLPWQLRKLLRWRTSLLTPVIVKQTITRSGFRPSRYTCSGDDLDTTESSDWILYFGKHMKGPVFKTIREYQKVNHLPGSFQLGRKDRLWRNIYRMQQEIGNNDFDFIPQTFCLPTDLELFKQCWENGGSKHKWIIKPPASARGIGVKVVYKWNQIPKRRPVVVQRYISNPYLINDSKFDLRLYVFITDINPLRIYLYNDGLVRFASTKYSNSVKTLHNRFVHLTNYSINKQNIEYLDNNDNEACKGHKWSLKSLWSYLKRRGVNTDNVWHKIKDLVVKTIISAEEAINASVKMYCKSNYSVQELFGFDVILDENLKPWILEVNVSPSLHSDSPLDIIVKGGMIKDMFNLSGFILPEPTDIEPATVGRSKSPSNPIAPVSDVFIDRRFWLYEPSSDELEKMKHFVSLATNDTQFRFDPSDNLPYSILDCLTPNDVRCLIQCLDENERRGHFERVYPSASINTSKRYLSYFERIHYANLLVASFLTKYSRNNQGMRLIENLCQKKLHLLSAQNGDKIDSKHIWKAPNCS